VTTINAWAILVLKSITKGILLPWMTLSHNHAIVSAVQGIVVYVTVFTAPGLLFITPLMAKRD